MVQLQVAGQSKAAAANYVSIPSWYNYKRLGISLIVTGLVRFNSIMVQLQAALSVLAQSRLSCVSIPSWYNYKLALSFASRGVIRFNSIMVQLQGALFQSHTKQLNKFQFHHGTITSWLTGSCHLRSLRVSIPSWYNYKEM